MITAIKKLFTGLWAFIAGIVGGIGGWLLDRNSIAHAECELERARRKQEADKLAVARLEVRGDELKEKELKEAVSALNAAQAEYNRQLYQIQQQMNHVETLKTANAKDDSLLKAAEATLGEMRVAGISALRYVNACKEKKAVVEKYIALLAENYAKGIQVITERGGKLDIAKYELETLKLKKSIADDSEGALFSGNVDDAVAAVRRLIKEYDALEKVKAATERPVVPEQVVAAPAFDADLVKQLDSDLGVAQPVETDELEP